ncbi:glucose-6-phosphatase [Nilaparvata lugens]|nr:glucose-6-phosphatase [Nilaparvata lugens]
MISFMTLMHHVYLHQAYYMQIFQQIDLPHAREFFMGVTKLSDPAYAIAIIFPVSASINTMLATDVVVAAVVSEWSNTLLKWLLMEHRPFWWVREYGDSSNINLLQTSLTCETGPGSPSGHVMGSAAVLYVFLRFFQKLCVGGNKEDPGSRIECFSPKRRSVGVTLLWICFVVILVLVSLSRIYISAHFPHQCLLGALIGCLLGYVLIEEKGRFSVGNWWKKASRGAMLITAIVFTSISVFAFLFQLVIGVDPQWSIRLAFKWCQSPEYIHASTTPLFSLARDAGIMFGLAFASPIDKRARVKFYPVVGVALVIMLVVSIQMLGDFIPTDNALSFYVGQLTARRIVIEGSNWLKNSALGAARRTVKTEASGTSSLKGAMFGRMHSLLRGSRFGSDLESQLVGDFTDMSCLIEELRKYSQLFCARHPTSDLAHPFIYKARRENFSHYGEFGGERWRGESAHREAHQNRHTSTLPDSNASAVSDSRASSLPDLQTSHASSLPDSHATTVPDSFASSQPHAEESHSIW